MSATLLHISDLHFGTIVETAVEALLHAVDEIKPDVVVCTGDVTQRCRTDELRGFVGLIDRLRPLPLVCLPGNHDVDWWPPWRRMTAPLHHWRAVVPEDVQRKSLRVGDVVLAALPSVNPKRQVKGTITAESSSSLPPLWGDAVVRVAYTHHPIALDRHPDGNDVVTNAPEAAVALCDAGVDVLLSGHVHVPFALTTEVPFPTLKRPYVLIGAGTSTSWRVRGLNPRSMQVIKVHGDAVDVQRYENGEGHPRFAPVGTSHFRREAAGWRTADGARTA